GYEADGVLVQGLGWRGPHWAPASRGVDRDDGPENLAPPYRGIGSKAVVTAGQQIFIAGIIERPIHHAMNPAPGRLRARYKEAVVCNIEHDIARLTGSEQVGSHTSAGRDGRAHAGSPDRALEDGSPPCSRETPGHRREERLVAQQR